MEAVFSTLSIDVRSGVAIVTIDNPPLNLLDATLITDLDRLARELPDEQAVRVVVFQSADPEFFIAHGDMRFVIEPDTFRRLTETIGGAPLNPMQALHERIRAIPQVTIAKLTGFARGGGSEIAMAMDMRFAARGQGGVAQLEAPTGITPGGGGTQYLPRLVGRARALEAILGAGLFDADMAERYGWINRALDPGELDAFVEALAVRIARLPDGVIPAAKATVAAAEGPIEDGLRIENEQLEALFARPAAEVLTRAALAAGAQTRDGERVLEQILSTLPPSVG